MPENAGFNASGDRERQAPEQSQGSQELANQTNESAAVQQQIQAGEIGRSRQHDHPTARQFWQIPGASEAIIAERKNERGKESWEREEQRGFGVSF